METEAPRPPDPGGAAGCCHQTVLRTVRARQLVDGRAGDGTDQVRCDCGRRLLVVQATQASLECAVCGHRVGALHDPHGDAVDYRNGGITHWCGEASCARDRWFDLVPFPPDPVPDSADEPPGPPPPEWLTRLVDGPGGPDGSGPAPSPGTAGG